MRLLAYALSALVPAIAAAASLEDGYFAARDRYLAQFKKLEDAGKIDDRASKEEERARGDLERRLRQIVEPHGADGFPGPGKLSLETLFPAEIGAGVLDGLTYSFDEEGQLLVSTKALFENWLKGRQESWEKSETPPQTLDQALKSEFFYSLAISPDAAVTRYVDLPIERPRKASIAVAFLDLRSQDDAGATLPNEIIVSVARGGKMFIASAPAKAKIVADPSCEKSWKDKEAEASAAFEAYRASDQKNERLFEKYSRLQAESGEAFRRCFAAAARKARFFAELTREAQKLADRLAGR
jgi:hypothetical protein